MSVDGLIYRLANVKGISLLMMCVLFLCTEPTFKTVCYEVENVGNIDIPLCRLSLIV